MNGYAILFVPRSWALGRWKRGKKKILWALGPFRFVLHKNMLPWKEEL